MKALGSVKDRIGNVGLRGFGAALICAGALAFAGCGGTDDSGTTTEASSPPAPAPAATDTTTTQAPPASGGSGSSGAAAASAKVDIANFDYAPKAITVKTGGSITWTNSDDANHTATQSPGGSGFDTGTLAKGDSKTVTFDTPGTFQYVCLFHAFMTGTVTVK